MSYWSYTMREIERAGGLGNEIIIYTGKRRWAEDYEHINSSSSSAYVYWKTDGEIKDIDASWCRDMDGEHLRFTAADTDWDFIWEMDDNRIIQLAGHVPFLMGDLGETILRVDTIDGGRYTIPAGSILRLTEENQDPGRGTRRKILLELNDEGVERAVMEKCGGTRRLNVAERGWAPHIMDGDARAAVLRYCWRHGGEEDNTVIVEKLDSDHRVDLHNGGSRPVYVRFTQSGSRNILPGDRPRMSLAPGTTLSDLALHRDQALRGESAQQDAPEDDAAPNPQPTLAELLSRVTKESLTLPPPEDPSGFPD